VKFLTIADKRSARNLLFSWTFQFETSKTFVSMKQYRFCCLVMQIYLLLIVLLSGGYGVIFKCTYSNKTWTYPGSLYSCTVSTLITGLESGIKEIQGTHLSEKTMTDVQALSITRKTVKKIPENLADFFPNLKAIQLYTTELETISVDDLKPFSNLEYLNLAFNKLERISSNLFNYNAKLKIIYFHNNKLEIVGQRILDGLKELVEVDFQANTCISLNALSQEEIETLKTELLLKCLPLLEICPPIHCTLNDETDEIKTEIQNIVNIIESLKVKVNILNESNENLQKENSRNEKRISELEKKVILKQRLNYQILNFLLFQRCSGCNSGAKEGCLVFDMLIFGSVVLLSITL
jgi:Leucine rich repeat